MGYGRRERGLTLAQNDRAGPDFWQPEYWRALATNMQKMKFNFWGFHTYPLQEPLVWVGNSSGFDPATGKIVPTGINPKSPDPSAYETAWYQTEDFYVPYLTKGRGNVPGQQSVATSDFCCGASQLFERDCYGSAAQAETCFPTTPAASATVLNNAADMLREAFDWSTGYAGVDAAVGVEVPLAFKFAPKTNQTLFDAFRGTFGRIVASKQKIKTFWLWTTEGVENHGTGRGQDQSSPLWATLLNEIDIALAALKATPGASFNLGTNGWCLGPGDNASFFDKAVSDKSFSVGAISGLLGWQAPDPAFASMDGSRSIVIPW